jgi:hypothetical protein
MPTPAAATSQQMSAAGVAVILDQQDIDVFIGLDVGKSGHHAVALDKAGMKLFDSRLTKTVEAPLAAHSRRSCGPRTS